MQISMMRNECEDRLHHHFISRQACLMNAAYLRLGTGRQISGLILRGHRAAAAKHLILLMNDLKTAFQYYLDHYNQGRPIIIASHSQGTTHAERLLKEFFEDKPLKSKLVVAYIIGMAIPKNYFSSLGPCKDSTQTGCFVGWRTYKKGL